MKTEKIKTLVASFCIIGSLTALSIWSSAGHAKTIQNIKHAVGIYISPAGRQYFENHVDNLIKRNGVDLESIKIEAQKFETGVKTPEQLLPNNPEIVSLIKQSKYYFKKFFRSQQIVWRNEHNFTVNVNSVDVNASWKRAGVDFVRGNSEYMMGRPIRLNLNLTLNDIQIRTSKITVEDKLHEFLEQIGVEDVTFGFNRSSVPLSFIVPIEISFSGGKMNFKVRDPQTNLDDVTLALDFKYPMILPTLEIIVNGYRARTRATEIERLLRTKRADLMAGMKKAANEYLQESFAPTVQKLLNEKANAKFTPWDSMDALGSDGARVKKIKYRLSPAGLDYKDSHLHFYMNARIYDPAYKYQWEMDEKLAANLGPQTRTLNKHSFDAAVSLNQGFINRLLQLSWRRGYYDYIGSGSNQYKNVEMPTLDLSGRLKGDATIPPAMKLKIYYDVPGIRSWAVKNPIEVEFELKLKFPVVHGKVQMVVEGVNHNSVYVARKFARFEFLWPKLLEAARSTLKEMDSDLKGMVLADDIPVPTDIFGFPMRITAAEPDPNGNILVFMDYDL